MPRSGNAYSGLGPLTLIFNWGKVQQACQQESLIKIFSNICTSQMTLGYDKLTRTNQDRCVALSCTKRSENVLVLSEAQLTLQ